MENLNILLVLSGGSIFIYELLSFKDNSPKDSDKESKDLKDIYKIALNKNPKNENEILIVTKKRNYYSFIIILKCSGYFLWNLMIKKENL